MNSVSLYIPSGSQIQVLQDWLDANPTAVIVAMAPIRDYLIIIYT